MRCFIFENSCLNLFFCSLRQRWKYDFYFYFFLPKCLFSPTGYIPTKNQAMPGTAPARWSWGGCLWRWAAGAVAGLGWPGTTSSPSSSQRHSPRLVASCSCPCLEGEASSLANRAYSVAAGLSAWQPLWTCLIYQQRLNRGVCRGTFHWQVEAAFLFHFCL